jgi:putative two-component system response regulator
MDILVVDDQRLNLAIAMKTLQQIAGATVHPFEHSVTVLAEATYRAFDLVVVDFNMPTLDGVLLIRHLRRLPQYQRTPIVMLTASHDPAVRAWAVEAGATAFLTHPIRACDLLEHVRALLPARCGGEASGATRCNVVVA